jgi:hypothetical protein
VPNIIILEKKSTSKLTLDVKGLHSISGMYFYFIQPMSCLEQRTLLLYTSLFGNSTFFGLIVKNVVEF